MADGTNIFEPEGGTTVDSTEVDFGFGDVRDRQRFRLAGAGPADDVPVYGVKPPTDANGLAVRTVGMSDVDLYLGGAPVDNTNRLPTEAHLTDEDGAPFTDVNRLPVDIGTVTIQASFESVVSMGNTTTVPLGASETFVGEWEEVTDYAAISFAISTDVGTPYGGAQAQFSVDGVNVTTVAYTTLGPTGGAAYFTIAPQARFFRIVYQNDGVAQSYLFAEITFHFNAPGVLQAPIGAPTDDATTAQVAKSALHGRHSSGFWAALKSSIDGILSVAVENVVRMRGENMVTTGVLTGGAAGTAAQTYTGAGQTALMVEVPEGHQSTQIRLHGTFSSGSQVFFEGSADGTDDSWFSLNQRRNTGAADNDETTLLDAAPFGGPAPTGAGNSNWRGSPGGVKYFRVRCGSYTPGDAISVRITTSTAGGPIFQQGPPPLSSDRFATGTFSAPNQSIAVATSGTGSFAALLTGQWTGKVLFEQTIDGVTWRATSAITAPGQSAQFISGLGTANQNSGGRGSGAGTRQVRLRTDTDFVGSVNLSLRAGGGTFAVALTSPVQVSGLYQGSQTARFSVGTSAIRLDPSPPVNRSTVEILYQATGAANNGVVYVGFSNAVTAGTGRALQPGEAWTLDINPNTQLFAIASAVGQQVQVTELA